MSIESSLLANPPKLQPVVAPEQSNLAWDNGPGPEEEPAEDEIEIEEGEPVEEEELEVAPAEEEEAAYQVPGVAEEAPVESPRANKRIQQLVREKKEKEDQLSTVLAQLAAAQNRQSQVYEQAWQEQERVRLAHVAAQEKQAKLQAMQQSGFNPADPTHQFLLTYDEESQKMRATVQDLKQQLQQSQLESAVHAYTQVLDQSLTQALAPFEGLGPEQVQSLRQQALALATAYQMQDPNQAVQAVLAPISSLLSKKKKVAPAKAPLSPQARVALQAGAMKATAAGKPKGTTAGVQKFKTPSDAMDHIGDELWGHSKW